MNRLLTIAAIPLAFLKVALEIIHDARHPMVDDEWHDGRPAHFEVYTTCGQRRRGSRAA